MPLINPELDTKDIRGMINHLKTVISYLESFIEDKEEQKEEDCRDMSEEKGKFLTR